MTHDESQEWDARALRIAHNIVAINLAVGTQTVSPFSAGRMTVSAVPANPDDNNPDEERHYYVEIDELDHESGGFVTGIKRTKYELTLTKVVDDAD